MERETDGVNRQGLSEASQQLVPQDLERFPPNRGRGLCRSRERRHGHHPETLTRGQHPAEAVPDPGVVLANLLAMLPLQRLERVDPRDARPKRIRLVHHLANGDPHYVSPILQLSRIVLYTPVTTPDLSPLPVRPIQAIWHRLLSRNRSGRDSPRASRPMTQPPGD